MVGAIGLEPMKPEGGRFTVFCSCRCAILPNSLLDSSTPALWFTLEVEAKIGGRGRIRTHGGVTTTDFKSAALNHSATLP